MDNHHNNIQLFFHYLLLFLHQILIYLFDLIDLNNALSNLFFFLIYILL